MRCLIIGYGNQGAKRYAVAKDQIVGVVDTQHKAGLPFVPHHDVHTATLDWYDAAIVCTPTDKSKVKIVRWLLERGKHVLVEKPLWPATPEQIEELQAIARDRKVVCYVAYNHRYEPGINLMKTELADAYLGKLYHVRMFYGNGTAENVRNSWRSLVPLGVIPEVGTHLLDLCHQWGWTPDDDYTKALWTSTAENSPVDHALYTYRSNETVMQLEMSYLSWKNTFTIDVLAENGSLHLDGLTKWGSSTFTRRIRKRPSGVPSGWSNSWTQSDMTWSLEWQRFCYQCALSEPESFTDLSGDIWIAQQLQRLMEDICEASDDDDRVHRDDTPGRDVKDSDGDARLPDLGIGLRGDRKGPSSFGLDLRNP